MNARTCLVAAALSIALAACSDDTGILVDVHGSALQAAVARLDTMVIIDDGTGETPGERAWGAADTRQDLIAGELDLRTTPLRVMFRPEGVERDTAVWVAAVAYDDAGTVIGWGRLPAAIAFTPDLVKQVELHLHPARTFGDGCVVKDGQVVIRTGDDCDGDGFGYDVDCDDLDAQVVGDTDGDPEVCDGDCDITDDQVYPGNREACDGLDNDCDPATAPLPQLCVNVERDVEQRLVACGVGQRICDDAPGNGTYGSCLASPIDVASNGELCEAWALCLESGQEDCLVEGGLRCKIETGELGACVPASVRLRELFEGDPTQCSVKLIGGVQQGGWNVGLREDGSDALPASFVASCDPELVVTAATLAPRIFAIEAELDGVRHVLSIAIGPKPSDCQPGQPTDLSCERIGL